MSRDADDASLVGWEYYRRGEMEQAEQWWSRAAAENDNAAFNLAQRYLDTGRLSEASRIFRRLARQGVSDAIDRLRTVGIAQIKHNQRDGAVESLADAAEMGDADSAFNLGLLYWRHDEMEAARSTWELAVQLGSPEAGTNLGALLLQAGDVRGAEEQFELASRRGDLDASYNLGLLFIDQGRRDEAARVWRAAAASGHQPAHEALAQNGMA
jgi:tetratricopeptide (TPR) repeat protein